MCDIDDTNKNHSTDNIFKLVEQMLFVRANGAGRTKVMEIL